MLTEMKAGEGRKRGNEREREGGGEGKMEGFQSWIWTLKATGFRLFQKLRKPSLKLEI